MKLAVVGSRGYIDKDFIYKILNEYMKEGMDTIISGGANGVDTIAANFAKDYNLTLIEIIPDWNKYKNKGKVAFERNTEIWKLADEGVAFWDGISKGTTHSFKIAKQQGKTLVVFKQQSIITV